MPLITSLGWPLRAVFKRSLPSVNGTFDAPLENPEEARIARDSYGVPHITATTEGDLWFLNGVVHGQDRLWQLHSARMLSSGRLCEFAGAKALEVDRLVRQLGFRRLAVEDLADLRLKAAGKEAAEEAKATLLMLESFARGVNWAMSTSRMMPVEFWLTGQRKIEDWDPVDTLTVMRLYGFAMSFGFQVKILRQAMNEWFGAEKASAWTSTWENEAKIPHTMDKEALEAFRTATFSDVMTALGELPRDQGSNWWVLHGSKTQTGKPILCGDPHLSVKVPQFWYEIHLQLIGSSKKPGVDAYGTAPVGCPGMFIGHTKHFATSVTLGYCDVEDVFLERVRKSDGKYLHKGTWQDCQVAEEVIRVKGAPDEHLRCRSTCHGVLLEGKTLMRHGPFKETVCSKEEASTGDGEEATVEIAYLGIPLRPKSAGVMGIRSMFFARNFSEFDAALSHISHVICLNFGYADVQGHIGYVLTGEVPKRRGERGSELLPFKGWTGEHDWDGYITHDLLPKGFDPPSGVIISANHKIVDYKDYPHYLGQCWKSGYRAKAIQEELQKIFQGGAKAGLQQLSDLFMNVKSWAAVEFVEELKKVAPESDNKAPLQLLLDWDAVLGIDSVEASLYQLMHAELVALLLGGGCKALSLGPENSSWHGLNREDFSSILNGESLDPTGTTKMINEFQGHLHINVLRMLRSADSTEASEAGRRWWLEQSGGRDAVVNAALRTAVAKLRERAGLTASQDLMGSEKAQWGQVHMAHFIHPVSKSLNLPPGSPPFDAPSVTCPGDTNTIFQAATKSLTDLTATSSLPSLRVIFDLSDLSSSENNRIVTPLGQSGQFNSQHFCDQTDLWHKGKLRPMNVTEAAVAAATVEVMSFGPARRGCCSRSQL